MSEPTSVLPKLQAEDVSVVYHMPRRNEYMVALDKINLEINPHEFVCIVGPSGCGKTTFLNCVDGLLPITSGRLLLDGKPISGPGADRAMVFQEDALLPWRTVLANVAYGLEMHRRYDRKELMERARHFVGLVGLRGFEQHYPHELSGGMRQRANLARALATDPELLLLDEPFAALDAQTREVMQSELLRIWRAERKTALFITHQINEAVYLADRVFVFSARPGRLREVVPIDLPRPRESSVRRTMQFLEYEEHIWSLIEEQVRESTVANPA